MIASKAQTTANIPFWANSAPTVGPTNSVRRMSKSEPRVDVMASIAAICAFSSPSWRCTRTNTSVSLPKLCSEISPRPSLPRLPRNPEISAGPAVLRASIRMPPRKSMPRFKPTSENRMIDPATNRPENTIATWRKRRKSIEVSLGTSFKRMVSSP